MDKDNLTQHQKMPIKVNLNYGFFSSLILFTSVFWGCSVGPKIPNSQIQPIRNPTASAPRTDIMPEYTLGFGDVIDIKFFRNSEFNETVTIRPDGRISLQKVGELLVSGMTPSQVDSVVTETYGEFVLEPDVTVIVREFGGYQVYVLGEVESPGGYPIQRDMTVLQALAAAGGSKITAKLGSVIILRRGDGEDGEDIKIGKVDLLKSVKAKDRSDVTQNDIFVQPQDIVYVPKTLIGNVSDFMSQVYTGFLPPLDLYVRAIFYDRRR